MGSKAGYANTILHELGLYPGLKARRYLWCEPDDGCRLLLETYRDHDLATATAEIILGWKDEDPKALWTRLRAEGPVVAPTPREAARWTLALPGGAWTAMPPKAMYNGPGCHPSVGGKFQTTYAARYEGLDELPGEITDGAVDPREAARWCCIQARTYGQKCYMEPAKDGSRCGPTAQTLPSRVSSTPALPGEITDGAVDPREVARWCHLSALSYKGDPANGYNKTEGEGCVFVGGGQVGYRPPTTPHKTAARLSALPDALPGEITDGAVEPPLLPENTLVYIDPPYVNTTGYKHNLGRDRVVELALAWHAAGATVCISEQEAIPELVAQGWRSVEITGKRQGQRRTFSRQQAEYLTISPTPLEHEKVAP
jgi:hypothetical protein